MQPGSLSTDSSARLTGPGLAETPAPRLSTPPLRATRFPLSSSERWAVIGKTGSGKTEFTKYLTRAYARAGWPVLIIDPKGNYVNIDEGGRYAHEQAAASIDHPWRIDGERPASAQVQLYIPMLGQAGGDPLLANLLYGALRRGSTVVHIDDLVGIADEHSMPPALSACWSLGRSLHVPMFVLAARPREVPRLMFVQSENLVLFRLPDEDDRKRAAQLTGDKRLLELIPKYYFWYKHEDMDHARRFAPLSSAELRAR